MPDSRLRMVVILSVIAVVAASGPGAMAQFDAENPGLDVVGRWAPGVPNSLALVDGVAYVAHGARLEAVDVKGPGTPRSLGWLDMQDAIGDLEVKGGYLFVTAGDGGMYVVDARRPQHLRLVMQLMPYMDTSYRRLALAGDIIVAIGHRVSVIDISNPESPLFASMVPVADPVDVAVEGDRLTIATYDGLHVFDLSNPDAPVAVMDVGYGGEEFGCQIPLWLRAHDGLVYVGCENSVQVYDLSGPTPASRYELPDAGRANGLAFADQEVYVAAYVVTKYAGAHSVADWMLHGFGTANAVAVDGDRLVVAYARAGLAVYALDETGQPLLQGRFETGTIVENVTADGNRLWLACDRGGVRLLDLSDVAHPRQVGSIDTRPDPDSLGMNALIVCPRGNQAVVLGIGEVNLLVIEATPHGRLREIFRGPPAADGSVNTYYASVATSDGWIVWSEEGVFGLRVRPDDGVSMAPIAWPTDLGAAAPAGGNVLYAIDHREGALVLLTATATGIVQRLGSLSVMNSPSHRFGARDGRLWLADWFEVQVADISDPAHPRLCGRAPQQDWRFDYIDGVAAAGSHAFLSCRYRGMIMAEAQDPEAPTMDRIWLFGNSPVAMAAVGDMACLFDTAGILTVVKPQPRAVATAPIAPAQVAGLAVAPNPCNPRAMITFTMADAGPATVRVFDARGRLVRSLHDGWLDSGRRDLPWSGDDDDGRPAASGVYLVQARAGGRTETARVTVVR